MTAAGPGGPSPARPTRVLWGGRFAQQHPGSMDSSATSRAELARQLEATDELVILDPLGFPWEWLRPSDRNIPLVVTVPEDLDTDGLSRALGASLLAHLTPADRLVCSRPTLAAELATRWQLDPGSFVADAPSTPAPERGRGPKAVWLATRGALVDAVREFGDVDPTGPVAVACEDRWLAASIGRALDRPVRHRDPAAPAETEVDAVSALVLATGLPRAERRALLEHAFRGTRPGGLWLVIATVVALPADDLALVPSMDELTEELQVVSGLGLNVLDLRSLRWSDEPLRRGVLVAATSLATARTA